MTLQVFFMRIYKLEGFLILSGNFFAKLEWSYTLLQKIKDYFIGKSKHQHAEN